MKKRRNSRILAMNVLYQVELLDGNAEELYLDNLSIEEYHPDITEYAALLINGVVDNLTVIDQKITAFSRNWEIGRISLLDKAILRLATYELIFAPEGIQMSIVINEAVEIAKQFSSHKAKDFINGVLDGIGKEAVNNKNGQS